MASNDKTNLLFRLLNIWLGYNLILYLSSHLPHWGVPSIQNWMNSSIYFLLFLFSLTIFIKEKNNRDIFINLCLFLFIVSISFINLFIGSDYLFGSNRTLYYFYAYKTILFCFLINFAIIYITLKYLFKKTRVIYLYLIAFGILAPVFLYQFFPFLINPNYVFTLGNKFLIELSNRQFLTNALSFLFILFYGYLLYKNDTTLGEYINELMAFFFVFLVIDSIDKLSIVYNFNMPFIGQHILTLNLMFLSFILFKKMCFLCSDYGQFYEALVTNKIKLGKVKIQRRQTEKNVLLLKILKIYISQRWSYIVTIAFLFGIAFFYFRFPRYFTLNIAAFLVCVLALLYFINALYRKRSKRNYTLS